MITYPDTIPQPSITFAGDAETPTIRTDIETGLIEQEGRFSTGRESFRLSWRMSATELAAFEEWFAETLAGGVLVFGLALPEDGAYSLQPCRFVGGKYDFHHASALWFDVSAAVECLTVRNAPAQRTPPVPQYVRLTLDPVADQTLTLSHRNALLTARPALGSQTTLRIYPPTDETAWTFFGLRNMGAGETLITSDSVDPLPPPVLVDFPDTLPAVNQTFAAEASRRVTRLEMESGHPRQISASKSTQKTYHVDWEFSLDELQTFQTFFFVTLASGSAPFRLTLPVDGAFVPVTVRFVDGRYSEDYQHPDRFRVTADVDAITAQTVIPTTERPYPVFYAPTVAVTGTRRFAPADAGALLVFNPAAGETVAFHISSGTPEFGVLNKGLGQVLITRAPLVVALGSIGNEAAGVAFTRPDLSCVNTLHALGSVTPDAAGVGFRVPPLSLVVVLRALGSLAPDAAGLLFPIPSLELKTVLNPVGTIANESAGLSFPLPTITLD